MMTEPYAPNFQNPAAPTEDPGKTLGIVGLVLAFIAPLIGLIVSLVARSKSKAAGFQNGLATAGIVIGAIFTAVALLVTIVLGVTLGSVAAKCAELGPGVHQEGGVTYTCG